VQAVQLGVRSVDLLPFLSLAPTAEREVVVGLSWRLVPVAQEDRLSYTPEVQADLVLVAEEEVLLRLLQGALERMVYLVQQETVHSVPEEAVRTQADLLEVEETDLSPSAGTQDRFSINNNHFILHFRIRTPIIFALLLCIFFLFRVLSAAITASLRSSTCIILCITLISLLRIFIFRLIVFIRRRIVRLMLIHQTF
jgi:hypothetical protein